MTPPVPEGLAVRAVPSASDHPVARAFLTVLAGLLAGYMFLGRGFAHLAVGPVYVGDVVLAAGIVATAWVAIRLRLLPAPAPVPILLIAFMALGLIRTVPYLGTYGRDALRDGTLWAYGSFALILYILADRRLIERAARLFGRVLPIFALWLPICWVVFHELTKGTDPSRPGESIPLVFFKAGDMTVHIVGGLAFLILVLVPVAMIGALLWRALVVVPLAWGAYTSGSLNRGALLTVLAAIVSLALLGGRARTWRPVILGGVLLAVLLSPVTIPQLLNCSVQSGPSGAPTGEDYREVDPCQVAKNLSSVIGTSSDDELEGTKGFRLAWWTAIVDYTVRGPYFWTGKGFGISLADADGFQPTADHSLRAPHNSHLTTLARMGVPGFVLWVLLQTAFGVGLLRALIRFRRARDGLLTGVTGWVGVYWLAMMIDTSFDPYLEGPQGGIWFWVLIGLGAAVMRQTPQPGSARLAGIGLEPLAGRLANRLRGSRVTRPHGATGLD